MKLIYDIIVFSLMNTLSLYVISNLLGEVLIRGQRLKEDGAYFKVREIHHIKFQNFAFVLFNNENETQNLKTKKKKPKNENIKISTIVSLFKGALSGLRQFLAIWRHLKMMINVFSFSWKAFFVLKIYLCLDFLVM